MESRKLRQRADVMKIFPSGHPSGAGSSWVADFETRI